MGQNYPLNKRRGGGAWQWMLIGFVPGFLCAAVIAIVAVAGGFLGSFGEPQVVEVTREIQVQVGVVVTSTPDPLASPEVIIVTATSAPTTEPSEGEPVFATETPQGITVVATAETQAEATQSTDGSAVQPTNEPQTNVASGDGFVVPQELNGEISVLIGVQGGNFLMGTTTNEIFNAAQECVTRDGGQCDPAFGTDSTPTVSVDLADFSIEQTEVTFDQYVRFLTYLKRQGLSHVQGCFNYICIQTANERPDVGVIAYDGANYSIPVRLENLRNHPVYGVTWYGANAYCQAIGRRLPTEAEWEYAARGRGQNIPYPWGTNWANSFANIRISGTQGSTVEVTSMGDGRNSLLLYHMMGNVGEWTNDWYNDSYYQTMSSQAQATDDGGLDNPQGPAGGTEKSVRGGSFNAFPFFGRTYHRQSAPPVPETTTSDYPLWLGFRCAADGLPSENTSSGTGTNPSPLATLPVGGNTDANAQPTAPSSPEESETESGSRG